ncbi:MAG: hypothetical protein SRB2_03171 [Desulfobacteraceae bacterium Eth-SRB2]|nr:MAG: hypothetical protein SRB2_03171 [Desulfobacteraceae bacterium Eth-SRB2]
MGGTRRTLGFQSFKVHYDFLYFKDTLTIVKPLKRTLPVTYRNFKPFRLTPLYMKRYFENCYKEAINFYSFTRSTYSPVLVSIRTSSPSSTNGGT